MTDLVLTAEQLQKFFEKMEWKFCFIGGLALQIWGEQRLTKDIDLTLLTNFTNDEFYIEELLKKYESRISDIKLKICSPEDLIVLKAFADRSRDWADIETVIIKHDELDWEYINEQLTPLVELKEAPEILQKLKVLKDRF